MRCTRLINVAWGLFFPRPWSQLQSEAGTRPTQTKLSPFPVQSVSTALLLQSSTSRGSLPPLVSSFTLKGWWGRALQLFTAKPGKKVLKLHEWGRLNGFLKPSPLIQGTFKVWSKPSQPWNIAGHGQSGMRTQLCTQPLGPALLRASPSLSKSHPPFCRSAHPEQQAESVFCLMGEGKILPSPSRLRCPHVRDGDRYYGGRA